MTQVTIFGITFPSFTVDSDDVFGISRHPLPHVCCVFQHVPETKTEAKTG